MGRLSLQLRIFHVPATQNVEAEPLRVHLLHRYGVGLISLGETRSASGLFLLEKRDIRELFDMVLQGVKDLTS